MKKILSVVSLLGICALLLAACGTSASGNASKSGTTVTVQTGVTNFLQRSVTLSKGQSLQLVNTASDIHILSLGSWVNGKPEPMTEPGAPPVHDEQLAANGTLTIGPFNTPGTYHLYCTIHPNMNLTVIVK